MTTPTNNTGPPPAEPNVIGLNVLLTLRREIITYRRELPRLLAEGHEGRFAVIHDDQVVSIWDTFEDAYQAGRQQFGLVPFLAQPVDARDLTRVFPKEFDVPTP
jgi:hypothetical protein